MKTFSIVPTNELEIRNLKFDVQQDAEGKDLSGKITGEALFHAGKQPCTFAIIKVYDSKGAVSRIGALQIRRNGDIRLLDRTKPVEIAD